MATLEILILFLLLILWACDAGRIVHAAAGLTKDRLCVT